VVQQIYELIAENEKEAAATGKTITFGIELAQQGPETTGRGHPVMRIEFVCEPGKPARQVRSAVQDPILPENE